MVLAHQVSLMGHIAAASGLSFGMLAAVDELIDHANREVRNGPNDDSHQNGDDRTARQHREEGRNSSREWRRRT